MNLSRSIFTIFLIATLLVACVGNPVRDKNTQKALADMSALSAPVLGIKQRSLAYMQSIAHSKNPAEPERKRNQVIVAVEGALINATKVKTYNGDDRYKDAVVEFFQTMHTVLTRDYGRLVDMKKIAEESYDAMEAYIEADRQASAKLREAGRELQQMERKFAADYDIELIESSSDLDRKLEKAGQVMAYYNRVYLINFRSYKQEMYLIQTLDGKDVGAIEQNRESLAEFSDEGLSDLSGLMVFENDSSLLQTARQNLEFYKQESQQVLPDVMAFLIKKDQFEQVRKALEGKPAQNRTRSEIERYNTMVGEMNAGGKNYNRSMQQLNSRRSALIKQWNRTMDAFLKRHIPR